MPKYLDQLGSYDNFEFSSVLTAEEIDRDKLKKYVFGLLTDKAKAQDARDASKAETADVQAELDKANADLSSKGNPDLAAKLAKAEADLKVANDKIAENDRVTLAVDVAEAAGLTKAQAEYLKGTTEDELKASAEKFIKDNGIVVRDPEADQDDEDADGTPTLRRIPRSTVNPLDDKSGTGPEKPVDYAATVAGWNANPFG